MLFTCIVVDDDLYTVNQLKEYINSIPSLKLLSAYTNPLLAIENLQQLKEPVDFLFTDIEMPELSGLELANCAQGSYINLILVSAHSKYLLDGYDVSASQFLTKPFDFKKFEKIIDFIAKKINEKKTTLPIKDGHKFVNLSLNNIIAIEACLNYCKIHTAEKLYISHVSISEIEQLLKPHTCFFRISRSFIVSIKYITEINGKNIVLLNTQEIKIGKTYTAVSQKILDTFISKK